MTFSSDYDVVMDRNAEGLCHVDDLTGHLDVGGGW
ncbi:MAG: hypothetical protein K0Q60_3000, partial [Microvirga sp.]|nr:hypothetical protein [Microvirga sp.]